MLESLNRHESRFAILSRDIIYIRFSLAEMLNESLLFYNLPNSTRKKNSLITYPIKSDATWQLSDSSELNSSIFEQLKH